MRLTCPNCAADYDVPDGMIPSAGRHVQCTVCHTRWFAAGVPRAALSEDQILSRLENRPTRLVAVPSPKASPESEPEPSARPSPRNPGRNPCRTSRLKPPPNPRRSPSRRSAGPGTRPGGRACRKARRAGTGHGAHQSHLRPGPRAAANPVSPPRRSEPAKPADRPTVDRPAPLGDLPRPPRSHLRLEIVDSPQHRPEAPARSRFGTGLLLVLLLAALAFAAYLYRDPLAAQVPAAAPALTAYGTAVDDLRTTLEEKLAPFRRAVDNALN